MENKKQCCEECLNSKGALSKVNQKKFGGICGTTCDCHWKEEPMKPNTPRCKYKMGEYTATNCCFISDENGETVCKDCGYRPKPNTSTWEERVQKLRDEGYMIPPVIERIIFEERKLAQREICENHLAELEDALADADTYGAVAGMIEALKVHLSTNE